MPPRDTGCNNVTAAEAAARGSLLRVTPLRRGLIRMFDAFARFLVLLFPSPGPTYDSHVSPNTILVLECHNLGDVAISVPFLKNLRHGFPRARISILVDPAFCPLLDGQGIVDEIIPLRVQWARHFNRWRKYNPFSAGWISFARVLFVVRKRKFDWAFSGRMDIRDNFILWLSGARRRIGYGFAGGASFLTDRVEPDLARPHRADVWLHLLAAVEKRPDRKLDGLRVHSIEFAEAQSFLTGLGISPGALLIGVHPGARIATRRWGTDRFWEVARRVLAETDAHILWFLEPGEGWQEPAMGRCHPVSFELRPFLAVLSRCALLICNDSGPMHLANLLRIPVVAIFGPQKPEWFGPRGEQDRIVMQSQFWCRPCFDSCIFDQPYCLRTVSIDTVHSAVQSALRARPFPILGRTSMHPQENEHVSEAVSL